MNGKQNSFPSKKLMSILTLFYSTTDALERRHFCRGNFHCNIGYFSDIFPYSGVSDSSTYWKTMAASEMFLLTTQSPPQWMSRIKRPEREANRSTPSVEPYLHVPYTASSRDALLCITLAHKIKQTYTKRLTSVSACRPRFAYTQRTTSAHLLSYTDSCSIYCC